MVVVFRERLAIQYPNGWIVCPLGGLLVVYLASPARRCIPFLPESYVNNFYSRSEAYSLIHTNLSMISRPVSTYPISLINAFISAGLLYIHSHPKAVSGLGWNPPFRAYTTAVWVFFASNVFLIVVPFIPPAPGYQVYERLPYYVSRLQTLRLEFGFFEPDS